MVKEYTCPTCKKIFKKKDSYNKHMNRKTPCSKAVKNISLLVEKGNPIESFPEEDAERAFHFANCHSVYKNIDTIITYNIMGGAMDEVINIVEVRKIHQELLHTLPSEKDYHDYLNGETSTEFNRDIYEKITYTPKETPELMSATIDAVKKQIKHLKYNFGIHFYSGNHPSIYLRLKGVLFIVNFDHLITFSEITDPKYILPNDSEEFEDLCEVENPKWTWFIQTDTDDKSIQAELGCAVNCGKNVLYCISPTTKNDTEIELSDEEASDLYDNVRESILGCNCICSGDRFHNIGKRILTPMKKVVKYNVESWEYDHKSWSGYKPMTY